MPSSPLSTVVIVTWRGAACLRACLDAVAAQTRPHRTVVVDNASEDGSAAIAAGHPSSPEIHTLPSNAGYAGAIAAILPEIDTAYLAWLNDDAAPEPAWLGLLEDQLERCPDAAAASPHLVSAEDGATQSMGVGLTRDGHGFDLIGVTDSEVFGFCGGAALVRTAALRAVGGVAAEFFCYYEDTDASWRLRLAGWRILTVPEAVVPHAHGASSDPASERFHLWNERNRLLTLVRCAPAAVAATELARFTAITALIPVRRLVRRDAVPDTHNFTVRLRLRALAGMLARLPAALRARRLSRVSAAIGRGALWRRWAGR